MLIIYNLLSGLSDKPFESYDGLSLDNLIFVFFVHNFEFFYMKEIFFNEIFISFSFISKLTFQKMLFFF